jgi:hypothetical protein
LIRGAQAFAASRLGARQAEAAQHADRRVPHHAEMVDVFLKLRRKPQVAALGYRQFTTTSMGWAVALSDAVATRNRWPSLVTTYSP